MEESPLRTVSCPRKVPICLEPSGILDGIGRSDAT